MTPWRCGTRWSVRRCTRRPPASNSARCTAPWRTQSARDDPDRATWHRAAAADGPDADVADALHDVAVRAEQRGGHLAAADAFERSAALTVSEPDRATRLFGAARTAWAAGQAVRARTLASSARDLAADPLQRADIDRLRARIEVNVGSAVDAHRIFTVAARTVADHDTGRALEMACAAALNRTYGADSGATLGADVLTRPADPDRRRTPRAPPACGCCSATLTASGDQDWARAAPALEQALEAGREVEDLDVMGNLGNTALHLGHDEGARFYYSAMVSTAREAGAGMVVLYALERLMFGQLPTGPWTVMRSSVDEALTLARSVGQPTLTAAPLACLTLLAALTGSDDFDHHLAALEDVAAGHPLGIMTGPTHDVTRWAKGTRAAAQGDAAAALHHLSGMRVPALHRLAAVDRLEAAVRAGDTAQAARLGGRARPVRHRDRAPVGPRRRRAGTRPDRDRPRRRDRGVRAGRRPLPTRRTPVRPGADPARLRRVPAPHQPPRRRPHPPAGSAGDLHRPGRRPRWSSAPPRSCAPPARPPANATRPPCWT